MISLQRCQICRSERTRRLSQCRPLVPRRATVVSCACVRDGLSRHEVSCACVPMLRRKWRRQPNRRIQDVVYDGDKVCGCQWRSVVRSRRQPARYLCPGGGVVFVMVGIMSIISPRFPLPAVTTGACGPLSGAKLPVRLYLTSRIHYRCHYGATAAPRGGNGLTPILARPFCCNWRLRG